MNLGTMRAALKTRGFQYLDDTTLNQLLNDAQHEICEAPGTVWPFLVTSVSGVAPLTISDVREVLSVVDQTLPRTLYSADPRTLVDEDPSWQVSSSVLTPQSSGVPEAWWLDPATVLRVWPANTTDTIAVRYVKVPADLSADGDVPVLPTRYHSQILDVAQAMAAARDDSDPGDWQTVRNEVDRAVGRMAGVLLDTNLDRPDQQVVYGADGVGSY